MQEPRKTYSREFKIEAVRLAEQSGKPVIQLARELGIGKNQIYKWKQQLERHAQKAFPGKGRETGVTSNVPLSRQAPCGVLAGR